MLAVGLVSCDWLVVVVVVVVVVMVVAFAFLPTVVVAVTECCYISLRLIGIPPPSISRWASELTLRCRSTE